LYFFRDFRVFRGDTLFSARNTSSRATIILEGG
jgi:hypothetical protein